MADDLRQAGQRARRVRRRHPEGHADQVRLGQPARVGGSRPACSRLRRSRLQAKQAAGIDVTFQTKTFNFLTSNYNNQNPAAKKYVNDWGVNNYGGINIDYYPTAGRRDEHDRRAQHG